MCTFPGPRCVAYSFAGRRRGGAIGCERASEPASQRGARRGGVERQQGEEGRVVGWGLGKGRCCAALRCAALLVYSHKGYPSPARPFATPCPGLCLCRCRCLAWLVDSTRERKKGEKRGLELEEEEEEKIVALGVASGKTRIKGVDYGKAASLGSLGAGVG